MPRRASAARATDAWRRREIRRRSRSGGGGIYLAESVLPKWPILTKLGGAAHSYGTACRATHLRGDPSDTHLNVGLLLSSRYPIRELQEE